MNISIQTRFSGAKMTIKTHFIFNHWDFFPETLDAGSDEQGKIWRNLRVDTEASGMKAWWWKPKQAKKFKSKLLLKHQERQCGYTAICQTKLIAIKKTKAGFIKLCRRNILIKIQKLVRILNLEYSCHFSSSILVQLVEPEQVPKK